MSASRISSRDLLEQRPSAWAEQAVSTLGEADAAFRAARDAVAQAPEDSQRRDALQGRGADLGVAATIVGRDPRARDLAEARGLDLDALLDDVRDFAAAAPARGVDLRETHGREQERGHDAAALAPEPGNGREPGPEFDW